jgi:hypothetical protein
VFDIGLPDVLQHLLINGVAAVVLIYGIFFRRHRRRDLALGYVAFNVSLFAVAATLATAGTLSVGVGFGLFAVLSIVRLRSDEATQAEIGYTMVALVLGLLNGLPTLPTASKLLFSVLLVAAMYIADHPALLPHDDHARAKVNLDVVISDPQALRDELERRLGARVHHVIVIELDYVRETMRVDVRYHQGRHAQLTSTVGA